MHPRSAAPAKCRNRWCRKTVSFAGKARGGWSSRLVARVVGDAHLGGVGDDETDLGLCGKGHEIRVALVGIDGPVDAGDELGAGDRFALLSAGQGQVKEPILFVQLVVDRRRAAMGGGLDDDRAAAEARLGVQPIQHPGDETAQEVAAAKQHHPLRIDAVDARRCSVKRSWGRGSISVAHAVGHSFSRFAAGVP